MAKIFKVSGYFVDANGVVDKEKFEGKLESLEDLFSHHLHVEEADIGKWNDESPLNYDKSYWQWRYWRHRKLLNSRVAKLSA